VSRGSDTIAMTINQLKNAQHKEVDGKQLRLIKVEKLEKQWVISKLYTHAHRTGDFFR
jgi:hypothetical protein